MGKIYIKDSRLIELRVGEKCFACSKEQPFVFDLRKRMCHNSLQFGMFPACMFKGVDMTCHLSVLEMPPGKTSWDGRCQW